jgi:hypothetical protein
VVDLAYRKKKTPQLSPARPSAQIRGLSLSPCLRVSVVDFGLAKRKRRSFRLRVHPRNPRFNFLFSVPPCLRGGFWFSKKKTPQLSPRRNRFHSVIA